MDATVKQNAGLRCSLTEDWIVVGCSLMHGWQRRCQEDPVSLPSSRLQKTTKSSPHHVAQHLPTGSETTTPYAPRSSRFGSELPSVEDDVDIWCYAILELHTRNDDDVPWQRIELWSAENTDQRKLQQLHIVCTNVNIKKVEDLPLILLKVSLTH